MRPPVAPCIQKTTPGNHLRRGSVAQSVSAAHCTRSLCCGGFVVFIEFKSDSVDCSPSGGLMRLLVDSDGVSPDQVSAAVPTCGVPRVVNRVTAAGSDQPRRTLHCAMYAPTAMITSAIAAAAAMSIVCLLAFVAGLHLAGRLSDDSRGRLLKSRLIGRISRNVCQTLQRSLPSPDLHCDCHQLLCLNSLRCHELHL